MKITKSRRRNRDMFTNIEYIWKNFYLTSYFLLMDKVKTHDSQ